MCGLVFASHTKPVNKFIEEQFKRQRTRGLQGFGFTDGETLIHNQREYRILSHLRREPAKTILFHHRQPTSTPNVRSSCHPFSTKDFFSSTYIIAHNGHINNDDALKKTHEDLGIEYVSEMFDGKFNDTEALVWEVGRYLSGEIKELDLSGAMAFIAIEKRNGNTLTHFGKKNRWDSLEYYHSDKGLFIASELWRSDFKAKEVKEETLYTYNHATRKLFKSKLPFKPFAVVQRDYGFQVTPVPKYEDHGGKTVEKNEEIRLVLTHKVEDLAKVIKLEMRSMKRLEKTIEKNHLRKDELRLLRQRQQALGHIKKRARKNKLMSIDDVEAVLT